MYLYTDLDNLHAVGTDHRMHSRVKRDGSLLYLTNIKFEDEYENFWFEAKKLHLAYPLTNDDMFYVNNVQWSTELHPDRNLLHLDDLERQRPVVGSFYSNATYAVRVLRSGLFTVVIDILNRTSYTLRRGEYRYSLWEFQLLFEPDPTVEVDFVIANLRL